MPTSLVSEADFVIITALEKEAKAVVSRLENHTTERFQDRDIRTYHCGTIPIQGADHPYRVVVVLLPSMGEIAAANATTDALVRWNPQFVLMVGIAGGLAQDDLDLGDVVVADQVVGYEYGKVTDGGIKPRDRVYPASMLLLDRVRNFWDDGWTQQVNVPRPASAKRAVSKLFVGPIASGNKVITSTKFPKELTKRWPKLIAVEMEAEGVYAAVFDRPQIRGTLVIRGISDMADERKGNEWQEYAANAVAAFVIAFLKTGPVEPVATPDRSRRPVRSDEVKTSLAKLPSTDPYLIGREKELAALDAAWDDPKINILSLAAWGGVGKTALVNKWLSQLAQDNYRGAERVFGWSFYSQGAAEGRQVAADQFIDAALRWFGDPDPAQGSPWDKGERLAELIKLKRTLLILDGLEPLQNPPPVEIGRIKDPALRSLLRELARQNSGLVIITTRLPVDDLKDFVGSSVVEVDLENLSAQTGVAYLKYLGVKGTDEELARAAHEYGGHALALTLLGKYLATMYRGDVRQRDNIARLTNERQQGAHARRVMAAYERWFAGKPELDILYLMGLFDRPAERGALEALRKKPAIRHLTSSLQRLSHEDWQYKVENLRIARLLADEDPQEPETLDCHPLLREHFGEELRTNNPKAWREAHNRLYEYYKSSAKEYPTTLDEMAPLYAAVTHGCQAGRYQDALDQVYQRRILRGERFYSTYELGAFGADLAAMSGFSDSSLRQPVAQLTTSAKAFVMRQTGYCLRALGPLPQAVDWVREALEIRIAQGNWKDGAVDASILSNLKLHIGDLSGALTYAQKAVELADRSGDTLRRFAFRVILGYTLFNMGKVEDAIDSFCYAWEIRRARTIMDSGYPIFYSYAVASYSDILLSRGKYQKVLGYTKKALAMLIGEHRNLLAIAKCYLSLGKAHLNQALSETSNDVTKASEYLEHAIELLRKSGRQDELPIGLLTRAILHRACGEFEKAESDVREAMTIAERGSMGLHQADCLLEYAWLYLARNDKDKARESLTKAKKMIEEIGYHRRDGEVKELQAQL